jgi:four helix bundle protein
VAKIGVVVEEADESMFWLELLSEAGLVRAEKLQQLREEAQELTAIFTASYFTAKAKCRS